MRNPRFRHGMIGLFASVSLAVLGAQPTLAATHFGANLSTSQFPDNAYSGQPCDHELTGGSQSFSCTWLSLYGFNQSDPYAGAKAPADGKINKIHLIAGHGGSFRLYIAHWKGSTNQGRVVREGPKITYHTDACSPDCSIQSFTIAPLKVKKGDYLAVKASKPSFLRCNSGSPWIQLFKPPLAVGGSYETPDGHSGCAMLLEAYYA